MRDGGGDDVVVSSSADKLAVGGCAAYTRPSAEPIFPPALRSRAPPPLCLPGPATTWHRWAIHAACYASQREDVWCCYCRSFPL